MSCDGWKVHFFFTCHTTARWFRLKESLKNVPVPIPTSKVTKYVTAPTYTSVVNDLMVVLDQTKHVVLGQRSTTKVHEANAEDISSSWRILQSYYKLHGTIAHRISFIRWYSGSLCDGCTTRFFVLLTLATTFYAKSACCLYHLYTGEMTAEPHPNSSSVIFRAEERKGSEPLSIWGMI